MINLKSEDQIKNICSKLNQIKSYINIMICAIENEFDPPEILDISETMKVLSIHVKNLLNNMDEYMDYCLKNDLYD